MQRRFLVLLTVLVLLVCGLFLYKGIPSSATKEEVIKNTYEQLTPEEKSEIEGDWQQGTLSKITADKNTFYLIDEGYHGKEVYMVSFKSNRTELLGDLIKLVNLEGDKIIGYTYRK